MLIRMGMGGQLSGSVGGVTASRNRYGAYLRNRTVPVNPRTERQLSARAAFSSAALAWSTLTDPQRQAWQSYATGTPILNRLGETITLSSFAMFVRTNAFLIQTGVALNKVAPGAPGLSTLGTGLVIDHAAGVLSLSAVGGTALGKAIFSYSPVVSEGVQSFQGPFSAYGFSILIAAGGSVAVQTGFRYGVPLDGQRRFYRVRGIDAAGRLSAPYVEATSVII